MRSLRKTTLAVAAVAALSLTAACGSDDTTNDDAAAPDSSETTDGGDEMAEDPAMDPAANLVGPACADYAEANATGDASIEGMSQAPVADAAAANPLLGTLVAAVSGQLNPDVNLVDTLNGGEFTVFAPVDTAFEALDPAVVETLQTPEGAETLETVLTYHVVPGQITPADIEGTTQTTVQGGDVEITGSGDNLQVNGANVLCGGVMTANATVYLIDTVLMPSM